MGLQPPRRGLNRVVDESVATYRDGVEQLSDDVVAFLSEGTRTGLLGYLASDGRPLVAPVWFVVDGGELAFKHRQEHRERPRWHAIRAW